MSEKKLKESIKSYYKRIHSSYKNKVIKLHEHTYDYNEIFEATKTMISTEVTMGKKVKKFEKNYSNFIKSKYSLMCNSGSSANLLLWSSLTSKNLNYNFNRGDEVLVPALSWSTSVWPIIQNNLVPVLIDCNIHTLNIDIAKLEKSISKKTKAIFLVHVYGNPCNMGKIMSIAKKYNLIVVEDTCESMGAEYNSIKVGTFGLASSFSLYFSHHITSLEGGICVTKNKQFIENLRIQRSHGWSRETDRKKYYEKKYKNIDPRFIFLDVGFNLRPTEVQADFALAQLKKLKKIISIRRRNYKYYYNYLKKLNNHEIIIQEEEKKSKASWFGFCVVLNKRTYPNLNSKELAIYLKKNNIESRPIIAGNIGKHPAMKLYSSKTRCSMENSNNVMNNGMSLGLHQNITKKDIKFVCDKIKEYIKIKKNEN